MSERRSHRKVIVTVIVAACCMFTFCFAMVPLYNAICKATGINTSIRASEWSKPTPVASSTVDFSREVTIQFVAVTNENLRWDFYPRMKSIKVHPGANNTVTFFAKNNTSNLMIVQAIPSMTPPQSIAHFHKIECFCFRQQTLKAGDSKEMALTFQVDKELPPEIHTITLAYTLFDVTPESGNSKKE